MRQSVIENKYRMVLKSQTHKLIHSKIVTKKVKNTYRLLQQFLTLIVTCTVELSPFTTTIPNGLFSACNSINVSLLTPIGAVAGSLGTSGTMTGSGTFSIEQLSH